MTWLRSALRRLATVRVTALGYALLVLVTAFVFAAAPRAAEGIADRTLREDLAAAAPFGHDLELSVVDTIPPDAGGDPLDGITARGRDLESQLPAAVKGVIPTWVTLADTARWTVLAPLAEPATMTLRFQPGAETRITYTSGRAPTQATTTIPVTPTGEGVAPEAPVFEGAISESAASLLGVKLGDVVPLRLDFTDALAQYVGIRGDQWAVRIVGLFRAIDPADEFWYGESGILRPTVRVYSPNLAYNDVRVLMADGAYTPLMAAWDVNALRYRWRGFVDSGRVAMSNAGALAAAMRQAESTYPRAVTGLTAGRVTMASDLASLLTGAVARWSFALTMIASGAVGPAMIALVSLLLVALIAARRRRPAIAAWRTRGASTPQVLRATIGEGLLAGAPAAVIGTIAAIAAIPARDTVSAVVAAGVVLVVAVLAVGLLEIPPPLVPRGANVREGGVIPWAPDRAAGAGSSRRVAVEILVVILAVGSILLLLRGEAAVAAAAAVATTGATVNVHGLAAAGINPLVAAAPTLGVVAAAFVAGRLIPLSLRVAAWFAARSRGLIVALGMRRAARQGGSTSVVLVLFASTAITVFSAAAVQSLDRGADVVGWQRIGADYRVTGVFGVLPDGLNAATLPGVVATVAMTRTTVTIANTQSFDLLAVSMPAYARMLAHAPLDPDLPPALLDANPTELPVILSTALVNRMRQTDLSRPFQFVSGGQSITAVVAGVRDWWPGMPVGSEFVVASLEQLHALAPQSRFRRTDELLEAAPGAEAAMLATLAEYGPSVSLQSQADVAASIRQRPVTGAVGVAILGAVVVGAAYAVLALIVGLVLTGAARAREAGHLRLLGLSGRAPATLLALEFAPVLAVALALATGLGLGLFLLVGRSLGLGVLLGSPLEIPLTVDPQSIAMVLAGVVVLTAIAVGLAGIVGSRGPAAAAIRAGLE